MSITRFHYSRGFDERHKHQSDRLVRKKLRRRPSVDFTTSEIPLERFAGHLNAIPLGKVHPHIPEHSKGSGIFHADRDNPLSQ